MKQGKIVVRGLQPGDMASLLELCETRDDIDKEAAIRLVEKIGWTAFNNPVRDGAPHYLVAVRDGKVVGHLGRMPTRFYIDGSIEPASYLHDLYVHPDVRTQAGQGFFVAMQLYREAERASPGFCAMIWTNQINIHIQQARKYYQMWTERYEKLLNIDAKLDRVLPQRGGALAKACVKAGVSFVDRILLMFSSAPAVIERCDHFDERFDDFSDCVAGNLGVAPVKDSAYLNWKYIDRPGGLDSVAFVALDGQGGEILGYLVVINQREWASSIIAEHVVLANDRAVMCALLDAAIQHSRNAGCARLSAVATNPSYARVYRSRLFFSRSPRHPLFLAQRERSPHLATISAVTNWHMSMGDSEGLF